MRIICGYRLTGKDTLYNQLNCFGDVPFNWLIYYKDIDKLKKLMGVGPRLAFADRLKQDVQGQLKEAGIVFNYEAEKDTRTFLYRGQPITYRQMCIDHGLAMRNKDKDYWCRIVTEQVNSSNAIITDFRFPNEYTFVQQYANDNKLPLLSIRVFRKEVPIPPVNEPSEHSLDSFQTDLLLVRDKADFIKACELFPQYRDYIR